MLRDRGFQQRAQRQALPHRHVLEHRAVEQAHAGPGQARAVGVGAQQAVIAQAEVATRVVWRVGHHPQVGEVFAFDHRLCRRGIEVEAGQEDIARDHPEGLAQQWQRLGDAACGLQRATMVAALAGPVQPHPPACAVAQRRFELLFQPGGVDHHLAHPGGRQGLQVPFDQPLSAHAQQRLGGVVGQRAHPLAPTGGQDQGTADHGRRV